MTLLLLFLALDRPLVRGDSLAYLAWLDSLAGDLDFDLANQAAKFAHLNDYQIFFYERTQRYASVFPYGVAFLYLPFYWLAGAADRLALFHPNDGYFLVHQGVTFAYGFFSLVGSNLYSLLAALLAFLAARRLSSLKVACLSSLALFLGTPLLYYTTIEPLNSHIPGTFLVALFLYLYLAYGHRKATWFVLGLVAGLALLVRWQLVLYPLAWGLVELPKRPRRVALSSFGFALVSWHLPFTWWRLFGSPFVVPASLQRQRPFLAGPVFVKEVLFSPERGLFVWSPLVLLALLGLMPLFRRERRLSIFFALAFLFQLLMNASLYDWYGGWAFGMRRMTELYPLLVCSLAVLLVSVPPLSRKPRALLGLSLGAVLFLCLAFSLLLFFSHLNYINTVLAHPEGSTAFNEIRHQLKGSTFGITAQVIREHYGFWAWARPGP